MKSGTRTPVEVPTPTVGAYFYYSAETKSWWMLVGGDILTRETKESIGRTKLTIMRECP